MNVNIDDSGKLTISMTGVDQKDMFCGSNVSELLDILQDEDGNRGISWGSHLKYECTRFAWLPTRMNDGKLVWLKSYDICLDTSYFNGVGKYVNVERARK